MNNLLHQHLLRAQQRMKDQADKHRTEYSFEVGDMVYLKLQPYVQSSVATRSNTKLAFKYFGPYEVEAKVGNVAYKLKLPATSSVHPVFHVSQLKKALGTDTIVNSALPPTDLSMQVPQLVLDRRLSKQADQVRPQILVQWSSLPASLATWEDEDALHQKFPAAPAWGQAGTQDGGIVRNLETRGSTSASKHKEEEEADAKMSHNKRIKKPNL
uniref:Tf2-1-like SH3-like domain-containing protein n=1 Tax=Arundo donax TaxID=35708 RepID=A0A0A9HE32_ARUDO